MQGVLEEALAKLLGAHVSVIGAGRTDSGVHATGQVISFRAVTGLGTDVIERGVNALLPADVAVYLVREAGDGFHARYSAASRTYNYMIWNDPRPRPLLRRTSWWISDPLDVAAMERAAGALVGRHDFSAFSMKGSGTRERTVRRARWRAEDCVVTFEIEAEGFLRGMVRGIVGTAVQVGRGKLDAAAFAAIVASADRDRGGPSAPAHGLCLAGVTYGGEQATYHERPATSDEEDE